MSANTVRVSSPHNTVNVFGPRLSIEIIDRFDSTSSNVVYCITCTLFIMLHIGEIARIENLSSSFCEHLRDEKKKKTPLNLSQNIPISRPFVEKHECLWYFSPSRQRNLSLNSVPSIDGINECYSRVFIFCCQTSLTA